MTTRGGAASSKGKATKKLAPLFESMYEDHYGERYMLNWPMIKTAEKVGAHYTILEAQTALDYYFKNRTAHNIWDFLQNINELYESAVKQEVMKKQLDALKKTTKQQLEEYS